MYKKVSNKVLILGLTAILAVGSYFSVFAAVTFNVTAPSLARLGVENYVVSGSATCSSDNSTSYYMVDEVYAYTYENGNLSEYKESAYGYSVASAMVCDIKVKPAYRRNTGWYKNGSALVKIGKKEIYG